MLMTLFSWFTLPSASTLIASSTDYSADFFVSLIGILIGIAVGIPVAVLAVKWLINLVRRNVSGLFKGRRGGRRRRR